MNGLPGYDLWLTAQPTGTDAPEPQQRHLEDARDQLSDDGGDMPSDDQVYALACMLAVEEARAAQDDADEHAEESSREDSEYFDGDGPL